MYNNVIETNPTVVFHQTSHGLLITEDGEMVYNPVTRRLLGISESEKGYRYVHVRENGVSKSIPVHRLVCSAFHGPRPIYSNGELATVNHIDGNKSNNRPDNLEWCTSNDNIKHAWITGINERKLIPLYVKNVLTGEITKYTSLTKYAKEKGFSSNGVKNRLNSPGERVWFDSGEFVRYRKGDDIFSEMDSETLQQAIIDATPVNSKVDIFFPDKAELVIFDTLEKAANFLRVDTATLLRRLDLPATRCWPDCKHRVVRVARNPGVFQEMTPDEVNRSLLAYSGVVKIKLLVVATSEERVFDTATACAAFLMVPKAVVLHRLKKSSDRVWPSRLGPVRFRKSTDCEFGEVSQESIDRSLFEYSATGMEREVYVRWIDPDNTTNYRDEKFLSLTSASAVLGVSIDMILYRVGLPGRVFFGQNTPPYRLSSEKILTSECTFDIWAVLRLSGVRQFVVKTFNPGVDKYILLRIDQLASSLTISSTMVSNILNKKGLVPYRGCFYFRELDYYEKFGAPEWMKF